MLCHLCGKTVQKGDRFCTGCGIALEIDTDTTDTTDPVTVVAPTPDPAAIADEPTELMPAVRRQPLEPPTDATPTAMPAPDLTSTADAATADTPVDEPAPSVPEIEGDDEWGVDDPVWAPTEAVPTQPDTIEADTGEAEGDDSAIDPSEPTPPIGFTADMPATEPITEVRMDTVEPAPEPPLVTEPGPEPSHDLLDRPPTTGVTAAVAPSTTAQMPAIVAPTPVTQRFRFGAITLIAVLTGVTTLVSLFANVVEVTSDQRLTPSEQTPFGFRTGTWIADDLADNLSIAGLLAIMLMIAGGVASGFGWRWGSGLAGGAGLAVTGLAGIAIGLAQLPIDAAHEFARIPSEQQFTLTITRDLGYWLIIAAAALGVVLFFAAINDAAGDRRGGLNPWIAALGALAAVVAAAGPLLPEQQAIFSDNWYLIEGPGEAPAMLLVGRLVQLGLFLLTGVVGFLTVRRWGLGLAIGGGLPFIWLAASTLFELTDKPVGPGFRNPGAADMHIHGVTIIGVSAVAAMAILASIAAYDQGVRERR